MYFLEFLSHTCLFLLAITIIIYASYRVVQDESKDSDPPQSIQSTLDVCELHTSLPYYP
jgi:hypothetical protein